MKDTAIVTGWLVLGTVVLMGITWAFTGNDFFLYQYFAPKREAVRREVFEQSKAYRQGMVQELQNMQFEYVKASPSQQDALASIILHRVADFNENDLPPDLRSFIQQLRNKRTTP